MVLVPQWRDQIVFKNSDEGSSLNRKKTVGVWVAAQTKMRVQLVA
jgi:hypothetical protein